MRYHIYLDESGDLGWKFDKPYRKGGSSKYFTIAYLIIPEEKIKHIVRFMRKMAQGKTSKREVKGAELTNKRTRTIARSICNLFEWHSDITIGAITLQKTNTPSPIIESGSNNVLYNHMVEQAICKQIVLMKEVFIIPDKRSIPRESKNSCPDLLKSKLWLELGSEAILHYEYEESKDNAQLQFIDWVANFVWRNYEDHNREQNRGAYQILKPHIKEQKILFQK